MKNTLRTFALGAGFLAAGAMFAQDAVPTVVMNWQTHEGITANVRGGSGFNGKAILPDANVIKLVDGSLPAGEQVTTLINLGDGVNVNKGCAVDDAGNILIARAFPLGKLNWMNYYLIPADGSEAREITLQAPSYADAWNDDAIDKRADLNGRAIGNVLSDEGGVFYLTGAGVTYPIPVWIKNGEVQELEEIPEIEMSFNSTAMAIPKAQSMAELDESNVKDMFYAYSGGVAWKIYTINEDGEVEILPEPTKDELKAVCPTWDIQTQNGFEVFQLDGKDYIIRMSGATTWNADWILTDATGKILWHTDHSAADGWNNPINGNAGYGCDLRAEKVDDYTVRVYQIYKNSQVDLSFSAMYTISVPKPEIPEQHVYIAGQFQGWSPENAAEFTLGEDGLYTFQSADLGQGGFKISTTKGNWDAFNAGLLGVEGNAIATGNTYDLIPGRDGDLHINPGDYTLTIDLDTKKLTVSGEEVFEIPELYLRGTMNDWGYNDNYKMAHGELSEAGEVTYTWSGSDFNYEFKIASSDWGKSFGYDGALSNGTFELISGGEGHNMSADFDKVTFTLVLNKNIAVAPKLTVAGQNFAARKPFAYNLAGQLGENGAYALTFKSTGAAAEGDVVVMDAEGQTVLNQPINGIVKGENQVALDLSDLETGAYTWKVRIYGNYDAENVGIAFEDPAAYGEDYTVTGGVVNVRDANADAFGYTVVGKGKAGGYWVYEPDGTLVGHYHQGFDKFNATNGSSTTRGDDMHGLAVFADWSDKGSGYWVVDPLNPTVEPRNMLMVEGATQAANGAVTYNGVQTGSGSPTVAFWGNGEETKMFAFDEDIYSNALVRYDLGENTSIVAAPTLVLTAYAGKMLNTNIDVEACEQGFFVGQCRADGGENMGIPGLMFFNHEGEFIWECPQGMMPSWSSGIAINAAGNMIALSGYNGYIEIFALSFDEYGEPQFTSLYKVEDLASPGPSNRSWMQLSFDAANNLHIFSRTTQGYKVLVLPGETAAVTPAREQYTINYTSAIEGVNVDNVAAPVRYFNLQGVAVDAENLTPGIYIRRQGNEARKVVIR